MAGKLALKLKATALTAGQNILDKRDPSSLAADLKAAFRQMWRIWCDSAIEVT